MNACHEQDEAEDQPTDRVRQVLSDRDAELEHDLRTSRVIVRDFYVEHEEQQNHARRRKDRTRPR